MTMCNIIVRLSYRPGTLARAVSIFLSDLDCLEEGEFLNDKIIDFYLKLVMSNCLTQLIITQHLV